MKLQDRHRDPVTAVHLEERFVVQAPPGRVWDHLVDPRRVVACVPGGALDEVVDDRTFHGRIRIRVGPLRLAYRGRVRLAEVDAEARRVTIVGEARESAGTDSARLTLRSRLAPLPGGGTAVVAHVSVDVAGRIVELGRGVLEPLGHVVFQDFAACVRATVEAEETGRVAPRRQEALRALPLVFRAISAWVARFVRKRGRGTSRP